MLSGRSGFTFGSIIEAKREVQNTGDVESERMRQVTSISITNRHSLVLKSSNGNHNDLFSISFFPIVSRALPKSESPSIPYSSRCYPRAYLLLRFDCTS